jgi:protein gp37
MKNSRIEWTDHTFNPWEGCTKVSPGCANCYAEARNKRYNKGVSVNWGPGAPRRRTSKANWAQPVKWNKEAAEALNNWKINVRQFSDSPRDAEARGFPRPDRPRVFCASLADWLDDEVSIEWLSDLLVLISKTPHLDWLLLTKRPENWEKRLRAVAVSHQGKEIDKGGYPAHPAWHFVNNWLPWNGVHRFDPPHNIWIGTTVENQKAADKRIPELLDIPARVHFLSCEPLLEELYLEQNFYLTGRARRKDKSLLPPGSRSHIHWVIIGGESGKGARPFNIDWARSLVEQCRAAGVAPFVKQLGSKPEYNGAHGMALKLQDKKGGTIEEFPEDLRIREFPQLRVSASPREKGRP